MRSTITIVGQDTFCAHYVLLEKMFWQGARTAASIPELTTTEQCDSLLGADLTILFKHSPTCPVSLFAQSEVLRFRAVQPDTPIYWISVRQQRDLAHHIAARTGVRHESPQILVLRRGRLLGAASHDEITAELLASLVKSQ